LGAVLAIAASSACIGIEHEDIGAAAETGETDSEGSFGSTGDEAGSATGDDETDGDTNGEKYDIGSDTDGEPPDLLPRLFVAVGEQVAFYDIADELAGDMAPEGTVSPGGGQAQAIAVWEDRLFVAGDDADTPLSIWEGADEMDHGAAVDDAVPVAGFGGAALPAAHQMMADEDANLWIADGSVRLLKDAANLGAGSMQSARFNGSGGAVVTSVAHDRVGAKLIGADGGGSELPVWDTPLAAAGDTAVSWSLSASAASDWLTLADDRLFGTGASPVLRIWSGIGQVVAPTAPNVTVAPSGDLTRLVHAFVRDGVLAVCDSEQDKVGIFLDVASIQNDGAPDLLISDAAMATPREAILDQGDRLFVRVSNGVVIFDGATTNPTLQATLKMGIDGPNDIALMECAPEVSCPGNQSCVAGLCSP
jgi:hypothetical protein